jgi:N-methylhydantoinase A/oxoprolinase/acetone carboxylase beta subunit
MNSIDPPPFFEIPLGKLPSNVNPTSTVAPVAKGVSGVFSALGLLTSAVEHEHSASVLRRVDELDDAALAAAFAALETRALAALAAEGHAAEHVRTKRSAELRYSGQAYELTVPVGPGDSLAAVEARFHDEHRRTYGHSSPGDPVDVVSVRTLAQAAAPEGSLDMGTEDDIALTTLYLASDAARANKSREASVRPRRNSNSPIAAG